MLGGTDHDVGHGGGAGAHDVNRVRFPGPDDCGEGHYAAGLLAQARAEDRVRWQGRASWHPVLTYSTVMIASGWLAGAWYAWQIDADGATMTICLVGALSTVFPGIPWRELLELSMRPAEVKPVRRDEEKPRSAAEILDRRVKPIAEVRRADEL